jgi:transposase
LSTKIHATVDALGNPIGFHLTGGQSCDLEGADVLLPQLEADILLADKGFDADARVLIPLQEAGKIAVIPPKANRKVQREYDKDLYQARHLIENFFAPSLPAMTKPHATFSPPSTSPLLSSG